MGKKRRILKKYGMYMGMAALGAVLVLTVLGWRFYISSIKESGWNDLMGEEDYEHHYVMIVEDSSSALWQDIYRSARETAVENHAYLELMGEWFAGDYSLTDYVNIAVASRVDGIIVKPDGTERMRTAIDAAAAAGIPVVTLLEDDTGSSRKSFVGVNSYQMGTTYGEQILECMTEETGKITVLLNRADAGKDLVFKQLKATVQAGIEPDREIVIDSVSVTPGSTFDAEETIRDLLHEESTRPDILVCMNETDSECAYYAMVDYNQVERVQLIGYYLSDTMLGAVQKGSVPAVITIDTEQAGDSSIMALEEYYSMGYVSSYLSVDLDVITQQNAEQLQQVAAK